MDTESMKVTGDHTATQSQAREGAATVMRLWRIAQRLGLYNRYGHGHGIDGTQVSLTYTDPPDRHETQPGGRGQREDINSLR